MSEKKKILIIEDEKALREALSFYLGEAGYEVAEAGDGKEGLKIALDQQPDLVLLDQLMPGIDGTDVLKKIRKDKWGEHAQVIMMTNVDDLETMNKSLAAGVNDYILKADIELEGVAQLVKKKLS